MLLFASSLDLCVSDSACPLEEMCVHIYKAHSNQCCVTKCFLRIYCEILYRQKSVIAAILIMSYKLQNNVHYIKHYTTTVRKSQANKSPDNETELNTPQ